MIERAGGKRVKIKSRGAWKPMPKDNAKKTQEKFWQLHC
jgi:hypothetical protein